MKSLLIFAALAEVVSQSAENGKAGASSVVSIIALVISGIAATISGVALYKSWKTQTRQLDIEEAREEDRRRDRQKANLVARIDVERTEKARLLYLCVENIGNSEARDIKVMLDGRPAENYKAVDLREKSLRRLGPKSQLRSRLVFSDLNPTFAIEIHWVDDSGEEGCYRTSLMS